MTFHATPLPDPHAWRAEAACRNSDPDQWFPGPGVNTSALVAICAACPSRVPCLEFGMDEEEGIYGGLSGRERRRIRQREQKARRRAELRAS